MMPQDVRGSSQQQAGSASSNLEPAEESGTRRGLVGVGGVVALVRWRDEQIAKARRAGKPFFMGIPDEWYEAHKWGDENGHVSS